MLKSIYKFFHHQSLAVFCLLFVSHNLAFAEQLSQQTAAQFLTRSTFGSTSESIKELADIGYQQWLQKQINQPPSFHTRSVLEVIEPKEGDEEGFAVDRRMETWWTISVTAKDQLRQRVAFALSQIFVISELNDDVGFYPQGVASYYDILISHAFGNYRELLEAITLSPSMGVYLSMLGNQKSDPEEGIRADENFAREIMQLFSIGLIQLNPDGSAQLSNDGKQIPSYTLDDIKNLARVFTGWTWKDAEGFYEYDVDPISPMQAFEEFHDTDKKIIVGNVVIPAGSKARDDLNQALDTLFNHPNVGPFIGKQLIQRLVTSNPHPDYVARVTEKFNDNGKGQRGDMGAVIKAILTDTEAHNGHLMYPQIFGKLREPILRMTHLWRAFKGRTTEQRLPYLYPADELAQAPMRAPSVFNFYRPDYAPPGGLRNAAIKAPEFQITNESSILRLSNFLGDSIHYRFKGANWVDTEEILLDLDVEIALAKKPQDLVKHLNLLLMSGQMPETMQQLLINHLNQIPYDLDDEDPPGLLRALDAVFLVVASPQYAIQR